MTLDNIESEVKLFFGRHGPCYIWCKANSAFHNIIPTNIVVFVWWCGNAFLLQWNHDICSLPENPDGECLIISPWSAGLVSRTGLIFWPRLNMHKIHSVSQLTLILSWNVTTMDAPSRQLVEENEKVQRSKLEQVVCHHKNLLVTTDKWSAGTMS